MALRMNLLVLRGPVINKTVIITGFSTVVIPALAMLPCIVIPYRADKTNFIAQESALAKLSLDPKID
mgnify:CR=1 FL=1